MAISNTLYDKARERFLQGGFNWLTDTIKCQLLVKSVYTPVPATHEFLSDVAPTARPLSPVTMTGKAVVNGAADANDLTFAAVGPAGTIFEALLIYKDTGTEATSPLIAVIGQATGLEITANGGDIIVTWDNGPNKIFKL